MEPSLYVLSECIDWVSAGSEAAFARKPCNFLRLLPAKSWSERRGKRKPVRIWARGWNRPAYSRLI